MFEFNLKEVVFCLRNNRVHSAPILSRIYVDNETKEVSNTEQADAFQKFGPAKKQYATIHGIYDEDQIFHTKQDLLDSL